MKLAIDLQGMQSRESRNRGIGRYTKALLDHLLSLSSPLEYHLYRHYALPDPDLSLSPGRNGSSPPRIVTHSLKFPDSIPSAANDLLYKTALLSAQVDAVLLPSPIEVTESIVPDYADFPAALYTVLYDLIPFVFADRYLADPGTRALYSQKLRNVRRADLVLAISEATRQDAITHLGLKEDRVVYIGAGVPPFFSPLPSENAEQWREHLRKKFEIGPGYILYTGGEDWRKNLEGLVDAYALLPAALRQSFDLVIACRMTVGGVKLLQERFSTSVKGGAGRLVLTNYVSEDELKALYSLCDVFVFPSFYEGFGLPLIEAMACGAPVLAANNSSLAEIVTDPEQLFDAASPASISERIETVLTNGTLRARLAGAACGQAANYSWDAVARRAYTALINDMKSRAPMAGARQAPNEQNQIVFRGRNDEPEPRNGVQERTVPKRLAFFSPFRPLKSGISDYSEELLPELARFYEIDLYVDDGYEPAVETGFSHAVSHHSRLDNNLLVRHKRYEALLYQMGNSIYHAYMYKMLNRYAGITVAHDYNMSGMLSHISLTRPDLGISLQEELCHDYGTKRGEEIFRAVDKGELSVGDMPSQGLYVNRRLFTRSLGVIVHNQWSYDMAFREGRDKDNRHIALIPHLMPSVELDVTPGEVRRLRRKWSLPEDAFIFASCGAVARTKRPLQILDAFRSYLSENPKAYLLFVGSVEITGDFSPGDFSQEIARRGLSDRVAVSGYVAGVENFNEYLKASNVCISLRYPSNGETSGALLRMLAHGKPSIVSNTGSFADFPDDTVHKIPTPDRCKDEVGEITRALRLLAENHEYRMKLSENAAAYIRREHAPEHCARLYANFIEHVLRDPLSRQRLLADYAGRELAGAAASGGSSLCAEISDEELRSFLQPFAKVIADSSLASESSFGVDS